MKQIYTLTWSYRKNKKLLVALIKTQHGKIQDGFYIVFMESKAKWCLSFPLLR